MRGYIARMRRLRTMIDRVINKADLTDLIDHLAAEQVVVAPVTDGPLTRFQPVRSAAEISEHYIPTALPPSKYLLPTKEVLLRYQYDGGVSIEPQFDTRK